MNLILCGCDGTFKTTIANKLSSKFKIPIVKGSSFELAKQSSKAIYAQSLSLLTDGERKVIDRFIYSNLVYASLYSGYTMIDKKQRKIIEDEIKNNSTVIYLTASPNVIIERLKTRGDEHIETKDVEKIIAKYNEVMSTAVKNKVPVYTYDTGVLSSDNIVKQIELLFYNNDNTHISCKNCGKIISKKNSYFTKTHCYSCWFKIMTELLTKE